jgi:RNA-binding protein
MIQAPSPARATAAAAAGPFYGSAAIGTLTTKQLVRLRALAHPLKPFLRIGKEGLSASAERAVQQALAERELLKVKVLEAAPESARDIAAALAERLEGAHLVQVVGRTFVLYRPRPDGSGTALPDES